MDIVIAGGTGFIGRALADAVLARGGKVSILTREPEAVSRRWGGKAAGVHWDGKSSNDWGKSLDGADAVVNLAGANVAAGRWTPERKLALINSRVHSTRALVAAISQAARRPKTFVSASAVGYYGEAPAGECAENAPQGRDFLAALCGQWEREALAAEPLGVRVVLPRMGVVLGRDGGALAKMETPFKLGLGGRLGGGVQPFPWIHREDAVQALLFAVETPSVAGPVNLAAPAKTSNAAFSSALGRALRRPAVLPAPAFALKLALGEMAGMLLGGQSAPPKKLADAGFRFRYPDVDGALAALYPR